MEERIKASNTKVLIAIIIYQAGVVLLSHLANYGTPATFDGWVKLVSTSLLAALIACGAYLGLSTKDSSGAESATANSNHIVKAVFAPFMVKPACQK